MIRRIALQVLLAISLAFPIPAAENTAPRIERVENGLGPPVRVKGEAGWNILERMNHYKVPGVSIAVIDDFKIAWTKGYGVLDLETNAPVT